MQAFPLDTPILIHPAHDERSQTDLHGEVEKALLDGADYNRRSMRAYDLLGQAVLALRAMGDLLWEAQIFPESIDGERQGAGVICLGDRSLCLQFGNYRAKVSIVEDALTFKGQESDGEGSEVGVRSGHLRITLQVDAECIAQARGADQ